MTKPKATPHLAVTGLVHYLNHAPNDARDAGVSKELAKRSGMSKAQMYEYIGSNAGKPKKPPTEDEKQSAERLALLE